MGHLEHGKVLNQHGTNRFIAALAYGLIFELKIPSLSWLIKIKFRGGLAAKTLVATALYGKRVLLPRTKLFTLHSTKPQQARVEV